MNNDYEIIIGALSSDADNNPWGFNGKANGKCSMNEEAVFYLECCR